MKLLKLLDKDLTSYTGIGLGNFDGLHKGHMALINTVIKESCDRGLESLIYTFGNHPDNVISKGKITPLLVSTEKKLDLLNKTKLDYVVFDDFDETFSQISPEDFFKNILVEKLRAKLLVAGFNYRFGYLGKGDVNLLQSLGQKYDVEIVIIPPIKVDNEIVSSTIIRDYIKNGCMKRAEELLGRPYSIFGKVEKGRQLGSKLGFPTANIHLEKQYVIPPNGVYITQTMVDNVLYRSITNVGVKPTIEENPTNIKFETHILDFKNDIYNTEIEVFFLKKIREEKKFDTLEGLKEQVSKDIESCKLFFEKM